MAFSMTDHLLEKYGPTMRSDALSKVLHCHPSHIRAMAQEGSLPAIRVGARWVFPTMKIAAMLEGEGEAYAGK